MHSLDLTQRLTHDLQKQHHQNIAMELIEKSMPELFAQLGEAHDDQSIERFIASHGKLPGAMHLHEASFWSASQASFLQEARALDGTWSQVVDELNVRLHLDTTL